MKEVEINMNEENNKISSKINDKEIKLTFKKGETIKSLKGGQLPLTWRKRISLSKNENIKNHKWYHPKCIIWWPILQQWLFTEYKDNFLLLDYLILGDNPILNSILIKKILNKAILTQKHFTIGIVKQTSFDYWGYHYYKKEKEVFKKLISEINQLNKNQNHYNLITLVEIENNFDIAYYRQFMDNKNYCFFLSDRKEYKHFIENEMPSVAKAQRKLKESLLEELDINNSNFSYQKYSFPQPQEKHFNYIISSKVFTTTFQKDFNYETEKKEYQLNNEMISTTLFHHELENHAFGSAAHYPDSFSYLEDFINIDIEKIKKIKV